MSRGSHLHPKFSGPATDKRVPLQRDGKSPDADADASAQTNVEGDQAESAAEAPSKGKSGTSATVEVANDTEQVDAAQSAGDLTQEVENQTTEPSGLNQIQTIETVEAEPQEFDGSMMEGVQYTPQMMNQFGLQSHMAGPYNNNNPGFQSGNFGNRGGFNNAYGAATVLTGEPRGMGVAGAPTGPRAMREGRPNTGFSSRINNARFAAPPSVTSSREVAAASPAPKVRT